jgi:hypothetical protein
MLSVSASLICLCALGALALAWRCARRTIHLVQQSSEALDRKMSELEVILQQARQESARLASLLSRARQLQQPRAAASALAEIEALADPAALEDSQSLASVAAQLPPSRTGMASNVFEDNRQSLAIARLADQGLPAAEISRRLGVPVGEVELRLSLRAA